MTWRWLLWALAVIAFAMLGRRVMRAIVWKMIWVRDDGSRPLSLRERVLRRYQEYSFNALMFAWCKTRRDPMFVELPELIKPPGELRKFLDLGCGYGFAASFLLEVFPKSEVYAIEPSAGRVEVAKLALADRGHVFQGAAPDFENDSLPERFDAIFAIDMMHYLNDRALDLTLSRLRRRLDPGHYLIIRAPMKPTGVGSLIWNLSRIHRTVWGLFAQYRTEEELRRRIEKAGFEVERSHMSGTNPEIHWFVSRAVPLKQEVERLVLEPVPAVGDHREEHHA